MTISLPSMILFTFLSVIQTRKARKSTEAINETIIYNTLRDNSIFMNYINNFKQTSSNMVKDFLKYLRQIGYSRKSLESYGINSINISIINSFLNLSQANYKELEDMRLKIYKNKTFLSSEYVEHIINIPEENFDFIPYILNHTKLFTFKRIKLIKKLFLDINNYQLKLDFNKDFKLITNDVKENVFKLTGDERYEINRFLSLAYLVGDIVIDKPGIGSQHLKGGLSFQVRNMGTGFLHPEKYTNLKWYNKAIKILEWLKVNNLHYRNISSMYNNSLLSKFDDVFLHYIKKFPGFKIQNNNSTVFEGQIFIGEDADPLFRNEKSKTSIPIFFKHLNMTAFIEIEEALPLLFPLLFLNGTCPKLHGSTLREKSQYLIKNYPETRIGRLGCDLSLLLYDQIIRRSISMNEKINQAQHQKLPLNSNRNFSQLPASDPMSNEYWRHRKNEADAMVFYFGSPDLMLTFTYGNNWSECIRLQNSFSKIMNLSLKDDDFRFLPFESMMIFNEKIKLIRDKSWDLLIHSIGINSHIEHYCSRIEFQARGAPHLHLLIWLNNTLSLDDVVEFQQATFPKNSPWLLSFVKTSMNHTCNINRCKRGDPQNRCRFGFPKKAADQISYDENGRIMYIRTNKEKFTVEFSPILCFIWQAHCHINILKTKEMPLNNSDAASYVLKYNLKSEPSFTTEVDKSILKARYVSAEESMYRIFSVDMCNKDVRVIYQPVYPPEFII